MQICLLKRNYAFLNISFYINKRRRQAGAGLCQARDKLGVIVYIGVKVEVDIVLEVWIQLLARVVGGGWVKNNAKLNSSWTWTWSWSWALK